MACSFEMDRLLIGGAADSQAGRLEGVLRSSARTVHRALTGSATLELAAVLQPAVIIADAALPDMKGVQVCRRLLSDHIVSAATPVLLATATAPTDEQRLDAIRAGARECVGAWIADNTVRRLVEAYAQARVDMDRGLAECLVDPGTGLYNRRGLLRRAHELGAHASRGNEALSCLVLNVEMDGASDDLAGLRLFKHCGREVRTSGRLSDVVGRLGANQLAVFASATDARGAVGMAHRLARVIHATAAKMGVLASAIHLEAGYDAVTNLGQIPTDPTTLLLRAMRAMRVGRSEPAATWIRRFESARSGST